MRTFSKETNSLESKITIRLRWIGDWKQAHIENKLRFNTNRRWYELAVMFVHTHDTNHNICFAQVQICISFVLRVVSKTQKRSKADNPMKYSSRMRCLWFGPLFERSQTEQNTKINRTFWAENIQCKADEMENEFRIIKLRIIHTNDWK